MFWNNKTALQLRVEEISKLPPEEFYTLAIKDELEGLPDLVLKNEWGDNKNITDKCRYKLSRIHTPTFEIISGLVSGKLSWKVNTIKDEGYGYKLFKGDTDLGLDIVWSGVESCNGTYNRIRDGSLTINSVECEIVVRTIRTLNESAEQKVNRQRREKLGELIKGDVQ
jgi:hypothetical protein